MSDFGIRGFTFYILYIYILNLLKIVILGSDFGTRVSDFDRALDASASDFGTGVFTFYILYIYKLNLLKIVILAGDIGTRVSNCDFGH